MTTLPKLLFYQEAFMKLLMRFHNQLKVYYLFQIKLWKSKGAIKMKVKVNTIANVIVEVNQKKYEVELISNSLKIKLNGNFLSLELPIEDDYINLSAVNEDYFIQRMLLIEGNMNWNRFNKERANNNLVGILEKVYNKELTDFTEDEYRVFHLITLAIVRTDTLIGFSYRLHEIMRLTEFVQRAIITVDTIEEIMINSASGNDLFDEVLYAIETAFTVIFEGRIRKYTDHVSGLSSQLQREIFIRLLQAGLDADEAEIAMKSRLCDLEDTIQISDLFEGAAK